VAANTYVNFDFFSILKKNMPMQQVVKPVDDVGKQNATTPDGLALTHHQRLILLENEVEELRKQLEACKSQKP
jgi:hypothetical protein